MYPAGPRSDLQAEAAADDLFLDLGGAAEARLGGAEPPELRIAKSSELALPPVKAGSMWSARVAPFARCDLSGDHPPGDRLAAQQFPEPRRGPGDDAEPSADVPVADADLGSGELVAA